MSTTDVGREAEEKVAMYLQDRGHKIIAKNWSTRTCEIDVISQHKKVVYFTEVKFRKSDTWGDGLSYITSKKLKQMNYAAELWIHESKWENESQLQAASVDNEYNIEVVQL